MLQQDWNESDTTLGGRAFLVRNTMAVRTKAQSWAVSRSPRYRSKYYAIKTIWVHEKIFKSDVQLHKIDTVEQLGDIFTKGLTCFVFECLRKKIMG